MMFPTEYQEILQRIQEIDPEAYGKTRNHLGGAVTRLSPYISRGVISTRMVMDHIHHLNLPYYQTEKLIQELAWRDYWQQVWIAKEDAINYDLRQPQPKGYRHGLPDAIAAAKTGIEAIDRAIVEFYQTGYLHNHVRMYIASMTCNVGQCHWKIPAKWMYYHLLDADWASNALSWQWVAGANANKLYYANQENINNFCGTNQQNTLLDVPYEAFDDLPIPSELLAVSNPTLTTNLPVSHLSQLNAEKPTIIYNFYNLDPNWLHDTDANRILLLEPSHFQVYPVSEQTISWILELGKNIPNLQIFSGVFSDLKALLPGSKFHFKEHPLNKHYTGQEHPRDWMFSVKGYYPSFFNFWKKCRKELP